MLSLLRPKHSFGRPVLGVRRGWGELRLSTLRTELVELARKRGWQVHERPGDWFNLLFSRGDDELEWVLLRVLNGKITVAEHTHPAHPGVIRRISMRKVDHVHALLRAPVVNAQKEVSRWRVTATPGPARSTTMTRSATSTNS